MAEYDVAALRKRIPENRSEFFLGFSPWREDCQNWKRSVREHSAGALPGPLLRTVWDDPENRNARVLVDVVELSSANQAMEALAESIKWNQLAKLPEGPSDLGFASFVHPTGVPPAAFFVQGNVLLSIVSYASQPVDVAPWAYRIAHRLLDRPQVGKDVIRLESDRTVVRIGEPFPMRYALPWRLGDDGFVKIFASGATLTREAGWLDGAATRRGEVVFEVFAVEPGREASVGHLRLSAE